MRPSFYAVLHVKGGSGASSLCAAIGAGLALAKRRTLLLDLDPTAALTEHLTGDREGATLADVLESRVRLEAAIREVEPPGLLLARGDPRLSLQDRRPERFPSMLARAFEQIPAGVEFVLLDLPPAPQGAIVRGALAVLPGGRILAPVQVRPLDIMGGFNDLVRLIEEARESNPELHLAGVIPNRVNRSAASRLAFEALLAGQGTRVLPAIREAAAIASAPLKRQAVQVAYPNAPVNEDLRTLVKALLTANGQGGKPSKRGGGKV